MTDFDKRIKADNKTMELIRAVENKYAMQGRKLDFDDKIALAVTQAIQEVETTSTQETARKLEMLNNINKIICDYEELRPVLTKYFNKKAYNEKWGRNER